MSEKRDPLIVNIPSAVSLVADQVKKEALVEEPNYDEMNPGIRQTVKWLRDNGFQTTDSGDGKTGDCECDHPYPYVAMTVTNPDRLISETLRLVDLLNDQGITIEAMTEENVTPVVQASYDAGDGYAVIFMANVDDAKLFGKS